MHTNLSQHFAKDVRQLLAPRWPIVVDVESPVVEPCRHTFFLEYAVHFAGAPQQIFFPSALTHAEHNGALAIHLHPRMVAGHILQEVLRRIFVNGAVHISVETIAGVIQSAEGNHAVEQVGTAVFF